MPGAVPLQRRLVGNKTRKVGLLGCARAARCDSQLFGLVVIADPGLAVQRGRRFSAELRRTEQRQGLNLRYLRICSRQEPWRRWLPDTRAASWRIGHNGIAPVIGPEHDDPG